MPAGSHSCPPDLQKEESNPIKQDIKKDKLRFYPYNILWNYGMLPQTWEDPEHANPELGGVKVGAVWVVGLGLGRPGLSRAKAAWHSTSSRCRVACRYKNCYKLVPGPVQGDNDPVDVVEIGSEQCERGGVYKVKPLGAYAMIDDGELDWKIVCIKANDPRAHLLDDIEDVERWGTRQSWTCSLCCHCCSA